MTSKILRGMREAIAYGNGEAVEVHVSQVRVPDECDVRAIRKRLNLSQSELAIQFGFTASSVEN